MAAPGAQEPPLGARVLIGRSRATVRYVGPVDGQKGTWVGIEYDEASKGKHDGRHGDRRYFSCAWSPTGGSFVRLAKFLDAADCGRSLVAAAAERYGLAAAPAADEPAPGQPAGSNDTQEQQLYVSTAGHRHVAVELFAPDAAARRRSAAGATLAVLTQQRIATLGDAARLRAMLPSLTELDLSDNLVPGWAFVVELAAALPALAALNLSGNRLALPSLAAAPPQPASSSLANLRTLVLNGCGVQWQQAVAVAQLLPQLRELHLCANSLASLQLPAAGDGDAAAAVAGLALGDGGARARSGDDGSGGGGAAGAEAVLAAAFRRLELLDLEDNALSSWHNVAQLHALPVLRTLLLSGNRLSEVRYDGGFTSLRTLMLGRNRLASWEAAGQLDAFPALAEARLSDNPLTAAAPAAARYQCIARISRLTALNASEVGGAERRDAEVAYLRQVTDELAGAGDGRAREALLAAHPRFSALTQQYGELAPTAPKASAGSALAASMAQLTIVHGATTLQKRLPVSLTVGRLKLLLERLLRLGATQQALLLVPPEGSGTQPEDISDEEGRELRYFEVGDGWRLEVREADPAARAAALAAARQAAAAAHAARMEQHEAAMQQLRAVEQRLMA